MNFIFWDIFSCHLSPFSNTVIACFGLRIRFFNFLVLEMPVRLLFFHFFGMFFGFASSSPIEMNNMMHLKIYPKVSFGMFGNILHDLGSRIFAGPSNPGQK